MRRRCSCGVRGARKLVACAAWVCRGRGGLRLVVRGVVSLVYSGAVYVYPIEYLHTAYSVICGISV